MPISETIEDIYGFETSESFISDVTDKILPQIEDWQNRPLDEVYPVLCIDAIHYSVRDNGIIRKLAAYVIPGINTDGKKEVLTIGSAPITKYYVSSGTVSHLWTVPLLFYVVIACLRLRWISSMAALISVSVGIFIMPTAVK